MSQGCFSYGWAELTQSPGLFWSSGNPPVRRRGVCKELGGDAARTAVPTDHRHIPLYMAACSAYKSWGKKEEVGRCSELMAFIFPSNCQGDKALLFWRWLNTCHEFFFLLLIHRTFALPIKLSLSQPMSFLTFTLQFLLPFPLGRKWASSCMGLSWLAKWSHNIGLKDLTVWSDRRFELDSQKDDWRLFLHGPGRRLYHFKWKSK